ncbi:MAG: NAD(P)-dependent oxidoreductase, partial [Solirubrobacteraceae bacterium]
AVAIVGLGEMGLPMAQRLVAAGYEVHAYDAAPGRERVAGEHGISWASSAAKATEAAGGLAIVMVRTLPQVREAVLGEQGCLAGSGSRRRRDVEGRGGDVEGRGVTVIVMSTIDPDSMAAVASEAAARGVTVIDAPVSGGRKGAEEGTLAIMAAGREDALARVEPILAELGSNAVRVGLEPGHGQAVKLANQAMMAAAMAGTLEGLEIARRYGVDEETALSALAHGTGGGWVVANWDWMRELWERYEPGNALDVLYKDMRALLEVAGGDWMSLPVASASFQRLLAHWTAQPAVSEAHRRQS